MPWLAYKHTNLINGKSYIGITSFKDPNKRWRNGNGYYNHTHFFNAIQKYGWENFSHEILFEGLTKEDACQKEQELIIQYDTINNGYNLTAGGEGISSFSHSLEAKEKISKFQKQYSKEHPERTQLLRQWNATEQAKEMRKKQMEERWQDENWKNKMKKTHQKKVMCLNTGECFLSINEAAEFCNVSASSISTCLRGRQKTAGKHPITHERLMWQYIN